VSPLRLIVHLVVIPGEHRLVYPARLAWYNSFGTLRPSEQRPRIPGGHLLHSLPVSMPVLNINEGPILGQRVSPLRLIVHLVVIPGEHRLVYPARLAWYNSFGCERENFRNLVGVRKHFLEKRHSFQCPVCEKKLFKGICVDRY
jgi:hypothetical protein